MLAEFRERNVPMVLSGRDPSGSDRFCVDNDQVAGTRVALDHLAEQGGRRIALLAGDTHDAFTADCIAPTRVVRRTIVRTDDYDGQAGPDGPHRRSRPTLKANDPPDAVYANDELLGIALLGAARRRGSTFQTT